jgi:long-chain acyl-CoA synthetase
VDTVEEGGQKVEKRSLQNILTYKEGHDVAVRLASSLLKNKLTHEEKEAKLNLIGIYSRNRQEFYLSDLACILYGVTSVPLYDTLGVDNLEYCLQHSNIETCICSLSNAKTLLALTNVSNLKNLILCDEVDK